MSNLFLDGMFSDNDVSPSSVTIRFPNIDGNTGVGMSSVIKGLMAGEPAISAQNQWGTIINDLSNFQDFASLVGLGDQWSWIGASTMCWKGTKPLTVNFDFYLINYKPDLPFESKARGGKDLLKKFVQLASLMPGKDGALAKNEARVRVHGGYVADVLSTNSSYFTDSDDDHIKSLRLGGVRSEMSASADEATIFGDGYQAHESCSVTFGKKLAIRNLLLSKVDVTPSVVEVASWNGENRRPLYYRVNVGFVGVRALLYNDVDAMWKGV